MFLSLIVQAVRSHNFKKKLRNYQVLLLKLTTKSPFYLYVKGGAFIVKIKDIFTLWHFSLRGINSKRNPNRHWSSFYILNMASLGSGPKLFWGLYLWLRPGKQGAAGVDVGPWQGLEVVQLVESLSVPMVGFPDPAPLSSSYGWVNHRVTKR